MTVVVDGRVIGVLTMSVGCDYFGNILGGMARPPAAAGGRMIAMALLRRRMQAPGSVDA